jgi:hypothetical protein
MLDFGSSFAELTLIVGLPIFSVDDEEGRVISPSTLSIVGFFFFHILLFGFDRTLDHHSAGEGISLLRGGVGFDLAVYQGRQSGGGEVVLHAHARVSAKRCVVYIASVRGDRKCGVINYFCHFV